MKLTKDAAARIDAMSFANANGVVETRVGFAIELFFLGGGDERTRLSLCDILRQYHALFGEEISHYLRENTSRLTRVSGSDYLDYYETVARTLGPSEPMDAMVFGYPGGKIVDEPTPVSISFASGGPEPLSPLGRSMISAYFPARIIAEHGFDLLLDLTRRWASSLEVLHGGAGYSLLFEHGIFAAGANAPETVLPPLGRFPGLDFSDPMHFQVESDYGNGRQIKSINWLSVIDSEIAESLGGVEGLAERLAPTCPIHRIEGGLIIQAGAAPQMGDSGGGLEDYARVAKALKPFRFEDYRRGLFVLPEPHDKMRETLAWLRRFD